MDNQINFTGIQNMGALNQIAVDFKTLQPLHRKYLIAQLTNDYFGHDYDKFQKAVDSCRELIKFDNFPFDKQFMHIFTEKPFKLDVTPKLFLNFKEVPVSDKTLKLYGFLAKFTRTLERMKPQDYKIAQDFKYGPDGDIYIMGDSAISDFCKSEQNFADLANQIYSAQSVKSVSKAINEDIQSKMTEYFA